MSMLWNPRRLMQRDKWDYRRSDLDYTIGALVNIGLGLVLVVGTLVLIFTG